MEWTSVPTSFTDGEFAIAGHVDAEPTGALFRDGVLRVEAKLLQRAEIVVALGDTFANDSDVRYTASIGENFTATLLTLMRAMDRIEAFEADLSDFRVIHQPDANVRRMSTGNREDEPSNG